MLKQVGAAPSGAADTATKAYVDALVVGLDSFRYGRAINANATTGTGSGGAGGVDAMIAFCQAAGNSPGSAAMRAATMFIPCPAGGSFETLVLMPWLQASTGNGGAGLSASSSPTLASTIAALRSAAAGLTF